MPRGPGPHGTRADPAGRAAPRPPPGPRLARPATPGCTATPAAPRRHGTDGPFRPGGPCPARPRLPAATRRLRARAAPRIAVPGDMRAARLRRPGRTQARAAGSRGCPRAPRPGRRRRAVRRRLRAGHPRVGSPRPPGGPGPGRRASAVSPSRSASPEVPPADVFVYRDTTDQPGGPAATGPRPGRTTPLLVRPARVCRRARCPGARRGGSARPVRAAGVFLRSAGRGRLPPRRPGAAQPATPDPAHPDQAPGRCRAGRPAEESVHDRARKLEQIKDLYLTAEAIGEANVDKHFDQLLAQQRELISEYFRQPGPARPAAASRPARPVPRARQRPTRAPARIPARHPLLATRRPAPRWPARPPLPGTPLPARLRRPRPRASASPPTSPAHGDAGTGGRWSSRCSA